MFRNDDLNDLGELHENMPRDTDVQNTYNVSFTNYAQRVTHSEKGVTA